MSEVASPAAPWWASVTPGTPLELGFVRLDRAGSTQDWEGLDRDQVIARRAEYHQLVESVAEGFDAVRPLAWQGDGVMIFVAREGDPRAWSREPITSAAMRAGLLAVTLRERLLKAGFSVRLAAHSGRVVFQLETGKMSDPEIDRAGHLEHDSPPNAVSVSEDVYLSLPTEIRERFVYLGTTRRDGTVAFTAPQEAASRRDASRFDPTADETERQRLRIVRYVEAPEIRRLRYVGFRRQRREPPSLDLLEVFTPLDVEDYRPVRIPRATDDRPTAFPPAGSKKNLDTNLPPWSLTTTATSGAPRRFTEALGQRRHLVVLGDPGGGKSTLLRWLAVTAAGGRRACREQLGLDARLLPLLAPVARLLELTTSGSGSYGTVVDALGRYFHERQVGEDPGKIAAYLQARLEDGECLVLLDGLDEVPTDQCPDVARWIEGFAARYRDNRIVVTSRVFGYVGLDLPAGSAVVLRPFRGDQIHDYLISWQRAYRIWEGSVSRNAAALDRPDADVESNRLLEAIQQDSRLHGLASNPFLLSAMALIHRAEGQLPSHRVQLYEIFARALCETWSEARKIAGVRAGTATRIDFEAEAIPILGRLAFWLHEHHGAGVAPTEVMWRQIAQALIEESGVAEAEAESAAREFLRRASEELQLIIPRGPDLLGFLHLTFEEFFAAAYLHAKEGFERAARVRWFDARWEEVILLGVGLLAIVQKRPTAAGHLIRKMLRWRVSRWPFLTDVLEKQVLLAAKCCADAPNLEPAVYGTVADRFTQLLVRGSYGIKHQWALTALPRMRGSRFGEVIVTRLAAVVLADGPEGERIAAAAALGRFGDSAVEALLGAVRAGVSDQVRQAVERALGGITDAWAAERLRGALRADASDQVRLAAARALRTVKDERAVEGLLGALHSDPSEHVREAAVGALGESKDGRAVGALLGVLRADASERVRCSAARALGAAQVRGEIKDERAAEGLLGALRTDGSEQVRAAARRALEEFKDERRVQARPGVRRTGSSEQVPEAAGPKASSEAWTVEARIGALNDANEKVRLGAVAALEGSGDARAMEALAATLRTDESEWVRQAAAWALGEMKDARAVEALIDALNADRSEEVRRTAARKLGEIKDARAVEALIGALRRDTEKVRGIAAQALWGSTEPRVVEALLDALHADACEDIRLTAAAALGELRDVRAVEALLGALRTERSESVRQAAMAGLNDIEVARVVEALLSALRENGLAEMATDELGMISEGLTAPVTARKRRRPPRRGPTMPRPSSSRDGGGPA